MSSLQKCAVPSGARDKISIVAALWSNLSFRSKHLGFNIRSGKALGWLLGGRLGAGNTSQQYSFYPPQHQPDFRAEIIAPTPGPGHGQGPGARRSGGPEVLFFYTRAHCTHPWPCPRPGVGARTSPLIVHECWPILERVQTHTMTTHTEAKINRKMPPLRIGPPGTLSLHCAASSSAVRNVFKPLTR